MKIVIATPIYPPEIGGPATYTKEICAHIADKHEITVITYTNSAEAFPHTRLIPVGKGRPLIVRLAVFFVKLFRATKNTDVIYVQNAMAAGFPVALVSLLRGVPFILKFVGDEAWERATQKRLTQKRLEEFLEKPEGGFRIRLMMSIQGFVLRRAKIVTTPSIYLGKEISKTYGLNSKRVTVNYNAAEETEVLPFEITRINHQVATTARLVAWKGIEGILRAIAIVKEKIPDVTFKIAGDGPELERLKEVAKELRIEDRVYFLGKISRAETWRLRKQSEIYVLNSSYEGLPHTVLTSFAAKIPTIATDIPGTNEAVYNEETGLLVPVNNHEKLAEAIIRLLGDESLQQRLVENGTKLLHEKFSWESHVRVLEGFLNSMISNPRH